MQKWEYRTITIAATGWFVGGKVDFGIFTNEMNRLGEDGWELVSAFDTNMGRGETRDVVAVFKRPLPA